MQDPLAPQHGKVVVHLLGVHNLGTDYPKIVVTCLANGTSMSWTFVTRTKNEFVSTPGGSTAPIPIEHQNGAPRLFLQLSDALKNDQKILGTAALDISGLLDPPYVAEMWVPLENARKAGAAVQIRASFVGKPAPEPRALEPRPLPYGELAPRYGGQMPPVPFPLPPPDAGSSMFGLGCCGANHFFSSFGLAIRDCARM